MLLPNQNIPQITLTVPGAGSRQNSASASRKNSPLASPRANRQKDNILIRACCPNCRYVFKVVDDNKLNRVKDKLVRMDTMLSSRRENAYQPSNNLQKKYANTKAMQQKGQRKRSQTPKFIQNSVNKATQPKSKPLSPRHITGKNQPKSPCKKNQSPKQRITTARENKQGQNKKQKTLQQQSKYSPIKKMDQMDRERGVQRQDDLSLKQDIMRMKKYLNKLSPQWNKLKQHSVSLSMSDKPVQDSWYDKINNSMQKMGAHKDEPQGLIQNYSSIHKKQCLQITRKCKQCNAGHIQIETALSAAKYKLVEKQITMMAHYVERDTSTPSYIKCLQQISEST